MHTMDGEQIAIAELKKNMKPPKSLSAIDGQVRAFYVPEDKRIVTFRYCGSQVRNGGNKQPKITCLASLGQIQAIFLIYILNNFAFRFRCDACVRSRGARV